MYSQPVHSKSEVAVYVGVDNRVSGMRDMADNMELSGTVREVMDGRTADIVDSQAGLVGQRMMWRK